jgi:hypothetical protein
MTNSALQVALNFILSTTKTFTGTDLTNYSAETYSEILGNFKVYGPSGNQIHNNVSWASPDLTISGGTTTSAFTLPSTAGVVPTGIYTVIYTARIVDQLQSYAIVSNDIAAKTVVIEGNHTVSIDAGASFEVVDAVTTSVTVVSSSYSSTTGNTTVVINETLGVLTALATLQFTLTTDYTNTFTQNYTYVSPSVCIGVDIDNCCSSVTLTDLTAYLSGATVTRLHTVSYPQGMVTPIADIESPLQTLTITPIYTQTWTDVFTATISGSQGIINISDTARGVQSFTVSADQYDCQISSCLQAVVNRYSTDLTRNPSQAIETGKYLLQALGVVSAYQLAKRCGDANATDFLSQITAITISCGCDCDCADCADDTPTLVVGCCENVAGSTFTILMTSSDGSITIDATTVGTTTTFDTIVSQSWFETTFLAQMNVTSINELSDVNTSGPSQIGYSLVWNGTAWVGGDAPTYLRNDLDVDDTGLADTMYLYYHAGSSTFKFRLLTLDNLSDVIITGATSGQIVKYNGTNWVNVNNYLSLLGDVNTTGIVDDSALKWDTGTSKWIVYQPKTTLASLDDVVIGFSTPLADDDTFVYVLGTGWVNQAKPTFVVEGNGSFNAGVFDNQVPGYYQVALRNDPVTGSVQIRGAADNLGGAVVAQTTIFTISNSGLWPVAEVPFITTVGINATPTIGGGAVSTAGVVSIAWHMDATTGARTVGFPAGDIDLGQIPTWYI